MREIKFRYIWENKEMWGETEEPHWLIRYFSIAQLENSLGFWCGRNLFDGYGQPVARDQLTWLRNNENEVDIYTGDIVSMHQFLFEGTEVEKQISGVIGWDEYGLTLKQLRNEFVEEYCGYDAGEGEIPLNSFYGLHDESWKVLGNVHQNPELLS